MTPQGKVLKRAKNPATFKKFRTLLNEQDLANRASGERGMHKNGKYRQTKRAYGDYLYHQDRDKFIHDHNEWLREQNK